jgi:hypothetical protein
MEENFNSSDLEFDLPEKIGPRVGRRALASIVQHSAAERIKSKTTLKKLQDVGNTPSKTTARLHWYTLFPQFAITTLRIESRSRYDLVLSPAIRQYRS